jgi:ABC-type hemin transport system substrate-binding protein
MRLSTRVAALCVGLFVSHHGAAAELPQRWVGEAARVTLFKYNPMLSSTRAARDSRVIELDPTLLVGGLGPRLPDSLKELSDGFFPGTAGQ